MRRERGEEAAALRKCLVQDNEVPVREESLVGQEYTHYSHVLLNNRDLI